MRRILVPLDGSRQARAALPTALELIRGEGGVLHLVTVVPDLRSAPVSGGEAALPEWLGQEGARAKRYLDGLVVDLADDLAERTPEVAMQTHVEFGLVVPTLLRAAAELDIDLMVLSKHGRGGWSRIWVGSVADRLLRETGPPILLVRDRAVDREERETDRLVDLFGGLPVGFPCHVLVALDGSEASEAALDVLCGLLSGWSARVTLALVLQRPFGPGSSGFAGGSGASPGSTTWHDSGPRAEWLQAYLNELSTRLTAKGVRARSHLLCGDQVSETLLELAADEQVDLIALTTRGRGGAQRLLLGSVADKLVRTAPVPVLAVPRPAEKVPRTPRTPA